MKLVMQWLLKNSQKRPKATHEQRCTGSSIAMYLITPTLLNSFAYYFDYEPEASGEGEEFVSAEQKEAAVRKDFLQTLSREKYAATEAMEKGNILEARIKAYCDGANDEDKVVREIGDICKGGMWQEKCKADFGDYLLYGKIDNLKRDTINDIKYTGTYDVGKYSKSMQHRIYLYCTGLPKFSYLISNGREWWGEDYFNHVGIEQEIRTAINSFIAYLENDPEARELYYSKWKSYGK